ncbi:Carbonic anhydrase [Melia azedarach]|uniref:Carbonic anhydrase n=1 Tax=Melia azedarach TaxID=155640 RepID=A0ACC1WQM0_MELAZ|nr:Carbonic anhydrase [Melia azedarach]
MVWTIRSKSRSIISPMAALITATESTAAGIPGNRPAGSKVTKLGKVCDTQQGFLPPLKRNPFLKWKAWSTASAHAPAQEGTSNKVQNVAKTYEGLNFFEEMKQRFLNFKKYKYLEELEHFQNLAEAQTPKFMVIACADSRVCPSNILGLQPGEAFMIRNVANLVPPIEHGPSETNAALEFAVNTLGVENILVIGHSDCGGIQTLMRMQDDDNKSRSLAEKWVVNAKVAKLRTKAYAAHLSFNQQCRHCAKESINRSLLNLLTYPWIEDRVRNESLSLHGGYYDLLNCTFEKWTLDYNGSSIHEEEEEGSRYSIRDNLFWVKV